MLPKNDKFKKETEPVLLVTLWHNKGNILCLTLCRSTTHRSHMDIIAQNNIDIPFIS